MKEDEITQAITIKQKWGTKRIYTHIFFNKEKHIDEERAFLKKILVNVLKIKLLDMMIYVLERRFNVEIRKIAIELKLPYIKENFQMFIDEANHTRMDYSEFLTILLERELALRKKNGVRNRLRYAKFPIKKYLEDFDRSKYGGEFKKKFEELETLRFIENKENIILIGSP